MDEHELKALADQCICHPASRGIADIEAAGEGLKYLIAKLEAAESAVKQARIDALEEARKAVSAEELTEPEDNADDAYNCGVLDCVRAVEKLKGTT